jgi:N-acetylmuramoyl-L-alanine amidase
MRQVSKIVIHHSASDRDKTTVATIKGWHLANGWSDIGYHFVITGDGRMHLGRPEDIIGAHAQGHNTGTIGICVTGNFENQKLLEKQIHTLVQVLASVCRRYKLDASDIIGHRDVNQTSCPGKNLYAKLPDIRAQVAKYL